MAKREPPLPHGLSQVFSQSIGGGEGGGEGVALVVVTNASSIAMTLGRVWPGLWCESWGDEAELLIRLPPGCGGRPRTAVPCPFPLPLPLAEWSG